MARMNLENTSPNKDYHESVSTHRHGVCSNCGRAGHAHDKERIYSDKRPGHYHYKYVCPED